MNNQTSIKVTPTSETARFAQEVRGRIQDDIVVVAVEGKDDVKIFRKLLSDNNTVVIPTNGVDSLLSIDTSLYDAYPRNLIAIKDADFDHLNNIPSIHENVFCTDKHDMEMTMLDDELLDSIIVENIGDADDYHHIDAHEVTIALLNNLKNYSYIKWFNCCESCFVNFDIFNISGFEVEIKEITLSDALTNLYANAVNQTERVRKITEDDINSFASTHLCVDLKLLVCGHDFCIALSDWLKYKGAGGNINKKKIEKSIRLLYNIDKFKQTAMYSKLKAWEHISDRMIIQ